MVFDQRAMKGKTPSARWVGLISVPDVKAAPRPSRPAAARSCTRPSMLGERGETAVFKDPEGVAVRRRQLEEWRSGRLRGRRQRVVLGRPLDERRRARPRPSIAPVVGYETLPIADDGPRSGLHLLSGGFARAGIMQKQSKRSDARPGCRTFASPMPGPPRAAKAAGGKVLLEPLAMSRATVAIIADPTGAPVGIVQVSDPGGAAMITLHINVPARLPLACASIAACVRRSPAVPATASSSSYGGIPPASAWVMATVVTTVAAITRLLPRGYPPVVVVPPDRPGNRRRCG